MKEEFDKQQQLLKEYYETKINRMNLEIKQLRNESSEVASQHENKNNEQQSNHQNRTSSILVTGLISRSTSHIHSMQEASRGIEKSQRRENNNAMDDRNGLRRLTLSEPLPPFDSPTDFDSASSSSASSSSKVPIQFRFKCRVVFVKKLSLFEFGKGQVFNLRTTTLLK